MKSCGHHQFFELVVLLKKQADDIRPYEIGGEMIASVKNDKSEFIGELCMALLR